MKYRCKECQDEFSDEGEANFHSYEIHDMEFEDCIRVIEEETLVDDSPEPEENLDTTEVIDEEDLLNRVRAKVGVDAYMEGELSETEEKMLISRLLGLTEDKSVDWKAHDKIFPEKVTTKNAFQKAYQHTIESLGDEGKISCPLCGRLWNSISEDLKENLAFADQHKELEGKFPILRIHHMKTKHIAVWNLIADLFGIPKKKKLPHEQVTWTSNPESVSATETPEEFSKEELSEAISSSPELRRQFFRKWMKKLQDRD